MLCKGLWQTVSLVSKQVDASYPALGFCDNTISFFILFAAPIVNCFALVIRLIFWESAPVTAELFYLLSHVTRLEDSLGHQKNKTPNNQIIMAV